VQCFYRNIEAGNRRAASETISRQRHSIEGPLIGLDAIKRQARRKFLRELALSRMSKSVRCARAATERRQ
jgi:hypothetical protein